MSYLSTNQGLEWQAFEFNECRHGSNVVNAVHTAFFLSPKQGWISLADGSFLVTTDGALTRMPLSPLGMEGMVARRLHFFDSNNGLALARGRDERGIFKTGDGGKTWRKKVDLGADDWSHWEVLDRNHAWVGGRVKGDARVQPFTP